MRLEPVFLVAPKPKPPSITQRRAFLLAGATFFVGLASGGACGYSLGASGSSVPSSPVGEQSGTLGAEQRLAEGTVLTPTGDTDLDELRRLAVTAPIEELVSRGPLFMHVREAQYPQDRVLWQGVGRMASAFIDREELRSRQLVLLVQQTIEHSNPPRELNLERYSRQLQKLLGGK